MLNHLDHLPPGLLDRDAQELHDVLGGPTLIELPGRREPPLFVSVLLHGNEPVGWQAVQALLARMPEPLPRALCLFIGNVAAARDGLRRLDGQPDYNRVWPGGEDHDGAEARMMRDVVERLRQRGVFASVDVHNNTGLNPHYACVNRLEHPFLQLATLFGRTVVHFLRPTGVQSAAMAALCPAVTLECGRPGEMHGVEHASEYLEACLRLSEIPTHAVAAHDIDLFHTAATLKVPDDVGLSFDGSHTDLMFHPDIERLNFRELAAGTELGRLGEGGRGRLQVTDEAGRDVGEDWIGIDGDRLLLARRAMPSMLTLDERVVRQDCLCYLMERLPPPGS
ncbi:MAG: M14 family metallopeptidase [Chromatiales bacterium]|jgi:hypothetical protein|nr:M14 family metallopeptidase [Chromatiales bacterium]MDX9768068.1 M14 family metallopeptidase [Ectothiorhodospiraceae bacterium]